MTAPAPRTFGGWLLIGVDALIYASLVFITIYVRRGVEWPGVPDAQRVSLLFPCLAALAALSAAVAPRLVAALAAALFVGWTMRTAWTGGLSFSGSRYGALFYAFGGIWALHFAGAVVAAAYRARGPWLRRFLVVQGIAGAALMGVVLV